VEARLGVFPVPLAERQDAVVEQVLLADRLGLDLVGIQDHPYQRRHLDAWTLIAYLAGRTERVRFLPDVINLPLRLPSVLAKSAASLDVLSGGRVELGVGAGAFWEGIEAMGGRRLTPKESVDALEEAIAIVRGFWSGERSVTVEGDHHRVKGAKPGPEPAHPIGLWLGAYGPRMIRLTGQIGDGWLPSLGSHYLSEDDVKALQPKIDDAARKAGRDPDEVERAVNVMDLPDDASSMAEELARLATELRMTSLFVGVPDEDPIGFIHRLGEDVVPRAKELAA
jgi:alkanesulfonate monooxygenase SsuD/methylene tetrahydromethanopterin reductase-like flavin-dependent oxidoreductase (luciferase family)